MPCRCCRSREKIGPVGEISLAHARLEFSATKAARIPVGNKTSSVRVIVGGVFEGQIIVVRVGRPLHPKR